PGGRAAALRREAVRRDGSGRCACRSRAWRARVPGGRRARGTALRAVPHTGRIEPACAQHQRGHGPCGGSVRGRRDRGLLLGSRMQRVYQGGVTAELARLSGEGDDRRARVLEARGSSGRGDAGRVRATLRLRQQQRQVAVQGVRQQSRAERSAGNGGHGSHGASPRRGAAPILQILEGIHETADAPLYVRLYQHVRDAIVSGALAPGQRLPASRTLAEALRVSRNTVESALEQLRAEGFVQRRVGAGSIVAPDLPVNPRSPQRFRAHARTSPPPDVTYDADALSGRGRQTLDSNHLITSRTGFTFAPCVPDSQVLPLNGWRQILARRSRLWSRSEMLPPERAGYRPLREAIAAYVVASRGGRCDWRHVLVVGSVQQGIALVSRMLLDPGDEVWLEEPGYPGARTAFTFSGAKVVPVPVDDEGIDVRAGERLAPRARMAYVT